MTTRKKLPDDDTPDDPPVGHWGQHQPVAATADADAPASDRPAVAEDDAPALSWDDYLAQRHDLEAQLLALEARWRTRDRFPRWVYHASEVPRIVATPAEQDALGAGWDVRPAEPVTP
jgi:hypothetical protein